MFSPSLFVLAEDSRCQSSATTTSARFHRPSVAEHAGSQIAAWMFRHRAWHPGGPCGRPETGARNLSIEGRCWRRFLAVESRGDGCRPSGRSCAFSRCRPDWPPPRKCPLAGTARVKDIAPKDRGLAGGHVSRSTASSPPERGVPSEGRPPRERSDDHERQVMRPRRVSAGFAGRAHGAQERVANVCAEGRRQTKFAHKPFGGALRC
jgi:hypothetical protein